MVNKNCCGTCPACLCLEAATVVLPCRWDSPALVHSPLPGAALSSRAGKLRQLAHSCTLGGKLLSGTALHCDPPDTQLVCLSHLGFAQLLEETDLDKMTHLLLSTLEYLVRILGF